MFFALLFQNDDLALRVIKRPTIEGLIRPHLQTRNLLGIAGIWNGTTKGQEDQSSLSIALVINIFCSASLPLASTERVQAT